MTQNEDRLLESLHDKAADVFDKGLTNFAFSDSMKKEREGPGETWQQAFEVHLRHSLEELPSAEPLAVPPSQA